MTPLDVAKDPGELMEFITNYTIMISGESIELKHKKEYENDEDLI